MKIPIKKQLIRWQFPTTVYDNSKQIKWISSAALILLIQGMIWAQPKVTTKGKVVDAESNPLIGATVLEKGTTNGTTTDFDGNFVLSVASDESVLVMSYVGYTTREIRVDDIENNTITLEQSSELLDEVVVVGYGEQSRRTLTTAISKIDGSEISDISVSSVGAGLKGKISGARVFSNNFSPGADPVIRIRGGSSINKSNNPLVLIDGVEMSLADVNPRDISSIEVLKDAASTAIYGSRASNGVILVTTKHGAINKAPEITFHTSIARQETERMYDFLTSEEYISIVRPAVTQSPDPERNFQSGYSASSGNDETSIYTTRYLEAGEVAPEGWKTMPDPIDPSKTLTFQDNDIVGLLFKPAIWQNYHLGVNGGSELMRYSGSLGYTSDQGVGLSSRWDRLSGRMNVDTRISDRINFSSILSFTQSNSDEYNNQKNVIARGLSIAPTHRLYWDNGVPAPGYNRTSPNPLWYDYTRNQNRKDQRLLLKGLLDWDIVDGLSFKVSGAYNLYTWQYDYFERAHEFRGSRPAESNIDQIQQLKFESLLTYNKRFGQNSISILGGYSYLDINTKDLRAAASGASTDKIETLNAAPTKTQASTNIRDEILLSYFGRLSYDYKKKYLLSASIRRDGSSRFLEGNKFGVFPGISAGWMVSEESWFPESSSISYLKFRTSYGQTGNNTVGLFSAQGRYGVGYVYDGNAGIRSTDMPNQNLTWETSTQVDVGIGLGLFNDRITIIGDYFDKITKNLLFEKPLPNTSGYSSVETNVGKVKFYGFDIQLSTINIKNGDFEWDSNLTFSYVKNRVLQLPDNGREHNRIGGVIVPEGEDYGGIAEGEPLYRYYGYVVDHIIQNTQEAEVAHYDELARGFDPSDGIKIKGRKMPGDYEWIDRNGDGVVSYIDQFQLGVTVPHSTGGLGNQLKYKNWSFKVYMDWALGHSINDNAFMRFFMNTFAYNYALVDQAKNTWKEPGDDAQYARITANDPDDGNRNFARTSSAFNFNANYLCIREVTLSYAFPQSMIENIGFSNLSLYIGGNNLHYFTGLIGVSPEQGASTTYSNNYNNYPPIRRFSVGINATF